MREPSVLLLDALAASISLLEEREDSSNFRDRIAVLRNHLSELRAVPTPSSTPASELGIHARETNPDWPLPNGAHMDLPPASEGTPAPCLECPDCGYTDWASTFRKIDAASHGYGPTSPAPVIPQPPDVPVSEIPDGPWFGCFTGDCSHETQADCDAAIRAEFARLEQAVYGTEIDRAESGDSLVDPSPARQSPDAGGAETPQERVNRILTESRQAVQPTIDAEAQGENVGDVMDFVVRSPDTGAGVGTPVVADLWNALMNYDTAPTIDRRDELYTKARDLRDDLQQQFSRLQARNAELEAEIEGKVYAAEIALVERVFEKVLKSDDGDVDSADPADWIIAAVEADWRRTNEQAETAAASQAERIGELEADDKRTRAFIISCPWCGMQMESRPARFQITHLIDCGDKQTATAWQLQVDKADLDWLDTQRSDVTDDDNQPDGDVRLLGHAWGIYGACETIREAIRGARSTSTGK